ncbi:hypothetical protein [Natronosalvus halobius]|uniref:hypothetical protein n=1 Tax=Natronosalvus halobius TaxID=2953746 RepID=UPI00209D28DA|nr:hypothetical protein [Natronosalvus halobius]USZ73772.1 hypothetical protein NGM15_18370 [Natronosalvus halobius]
MSNETDHWQVVEITGVGIGEMWFDVVADELSQDVAERRAGQRDRHVAVPMTYDPGEPVGIGQVVDDYDRAVIDR